MSPRQPAFVTVVSKVRSIQTILRKDADSQTALIGSANERLLSGKRSRSERPRMMKKRHLVKRRVQQKTKFGISLLSFKAIRICVLKMRLDCEYKHQSGGKLAQRCSTIQKIRTASKDSITGLS